MGMLERVTLDGVGEWYCSLLLSTSPPLPQFPLCEIVTQQLAPVQICTMSSMYLHSFRVLTAQPPGNSPHPPPPPPPLLHPPRSPSADSATPPSPADAAAWATDPRSSPSVPRARVALLVPRCARCRRRRCYCCCISTKEAGPTTSEAAAATVEIWAYRSLSHSLCSRRNRVYMPHLVGLLNSLCTCPALTPLQPLRQQVSPRTNQLYTRT